MSFCRYLDNVPWPVSAIAGIQLIMIRHKCLEVVVSQKLVELAVVCTAGTYVS